MAKPITKEEVYENVKRVGLIKNFIILEMLEFRGNKTRFKLKCIECGYGKNGEWETPYQSIIKPRAKLGGNCPSCNCSIKEEDFWINLKNKLEKDRYTLLDNNIKFIGVSTNLIIYCPIHDYSWPTTYSRYVERDAKCRLCATEITKEKNKIPFDIVLKRINERLKEENLEFREPLVYENARSILHLKCLICGYDKINPNYEDFVNDKSGCANCYGNAKIEQDDAVENVIGMGLLKKNFRLLEIPEHKNSNTKYHLYCNECGYDKWWSSYNKIMNSDNECPKCAGNVKLTQEEAEKMVLEECKKQNCVLNKPFKYMGGGKTYLEILCLKCNKPWNILFDNFIRLHRGCNGVCRYEKMVNTMIERYGEKWFKHRPWHNVEATKYLDLISEKLGLYIYHGENGEEKQMLRYWLDGYIQEYNIGIEWNEPAHYSKKGRVEDQKKTNYILKNFDCPIYEINEKEFIKDPEININKILDDLKQLIEERKNNKIYERKN